MEYLYGWISKAKATKKPSEDDLKSRTFPLPAPSPQKASTATQPQRANDDINVQNEINEAKRKLLELERMVEDNLSRLNDKELNPALPQTQPNANNPLSPRKAPLSSSSSTHGSESEESTPFSSDQETEGGKALYSNRHHRRVANRNAARRKSRELNKRKRRSVHGPMLVQLGEYQYYSRKNLTLNEHGKWVERTGSRNTADITNGEGPMKYIGGKWLGNEEALDGFSDDDDDLERWASSGTLQNMLNEFELPPSLVEGFERSEKEHNGLMKGWSCEESNDELFRRDGLWHMCIMRLISRPSTSKRNNNSSNNNTATVRNFSQNGLVHNLNNNTKRTITKVASPPQDDSDEQDFGEDFDLSDGNGDIFGRRPSN
ncbi:hypothetical protein QOT17_016934 [Balamuthia mandrillaris]